MIASDKLASLTVSANTIDLPSVTTSGAQSYAGATTLNGALTTTGSNGGVSISGETTLGTDETIDTSSGNGAISLAGITGGAHTLTLNAGTGAALLNAAVAAADNLGGLTINAGTISLPAVTTSGAQTYTGTTSLTGDLTTTSPGNGVTLGGATTLTTDLTIASMGEFDLEDTGSLSGAHNLTLKMGDSTHTYDVVLDGPVGYGLVRLASFTIDPPGNVSSSKPIQAVSFSVVQAAGDVALSSVDTTGNIAITTSGAVTGTFTYASTASASISATDGGTFSVNAVSRTLASVKEGGGTFDSKTTSLSDKATQSQDTSGQSSSLAVVAPEVQSIVERNTQSVSAVSNDTHTVTARAETTDQALPGGSTNSDSGVKGVTNGTASPANENPDNPCNNEVPVLNNSASPLLSQISQSLAVQQMIQTVASAAQGTTLHESIVSLNTKANLPMVQQKAVFAAIPVGTLIAGLLKSDNSTARTIGSLLQQVTPKQSPVGYVDVKRALEAGNMPPAIARSYLAIYQRVEKEKRTELLGRALAQLDVNPHAADIPLLRPTVRGKTRGISGPAPTDAGSAASDAAIETAALEDMKAPPVVVATADPGKVLVKGRIEGTATTQDIRIDGKWTFIRDDGSYQVKVLATLADKLKLIVSNTTGILAEQALGVARHDTGAATASAGKRRKIAVLFANGNYSALGGADGMDDLETPTRDAAAVSETLKSKLGFETRVIANATKAQMVATLDKLHQETTEQDQVVVYYAGHGYEVEKTGLGYWIPVDGTTTSANNWISTKDVALLLRRIPASNILLISDSCYSGSFTKEQHVDSGDSDLQSQRERRGVMAMSSGGDEPVFDGADHSPFASSLIQRLEGLPSGTLGAKLYTQINSDVTATTPQTPQYGVIVSAGYDHDADFPVEPALNKAASR